eukprot:NODE_619_length_5349_cov_0.609524.p5 type:complete len:131 gc:universal NODE_619_length_5349_cov_0.609524:1411-1803(+)
MNCLLCSCFTQHYYQHFQEQMTQKKLREVLKRSTDVVAIMENFAIIVIVIRISSAVTIRLFEKLSQSVTLSNKSSHTFYSISSTLGPFCHQSKNPSNGVANLSPNHINGANPVAIEYPINRISKHCLTTN